MAPPERRRTTMIQRVSLAMDITSLLALISLVFWVGKQSQRIDELSIKQEKQGETIEQTGKAVNTTAARIDVVETKSESTTVVVRDLKEDVMDKLRRIEDKLDGRRR